MPSPLRPGRRLRRRTELGWNYARCECLHFRPTGPLRSQLQRRGLTPCRPSLTFCSRRYVVVRSAEPGALSDGGRGRRSGAFRTSTSRRFRVSRRCGYRARFSARYRITSLLRLTDRASTRPSELRSRAASARLEKRPHWPSRNRARGSLERRLLDALPSMPSRPRSGRIGKTTSSSFRHRRRSREGPRARVGRAVTKRVAVLACGVSHLRLDTSSAEIERPRRLARHSSSTALGGVLLLRSAPCSRRHSPGVPRGRPASSAGGR